MHSRWLPVKVHGPLFARNSKGGVSGDDAFGIIQYGLNGDGKFSLHSSARRSSFISYCTVLMSYFSEMGSFLVRQKKGKWARN